MSEDESSIKYLRMRVDVLVSNSEEAQEVSDVFIKQAQLLESDGLVGGKVHITGDVIVPQQCAFWTSPISSRVNCNQPVRLDACIGVTDSSFGAVTGSDFASWPCWGVGSWSDGNARN